MTEENTYVDNLWKDARDMIRSMDETKLKIKQALSRNAAIDKAVKTLDEMHMDFAKKEILDKIKEVPKADILALTKHYYSLLLDGRELLGQVRIVSESNGDYPTDQKVIDTLKKLENGLKKELRDNGIFDLAMTAIDKELGLD